MKWKISVRKANNYHSSLRSVEWYKQRYLGGGLSSDGMARSVPKLLCCGAHKAGGGGLTGHYGDGLG